MNIPNILTCFRIAAVPAIALCMFAFDPPLSNQLAFWMFVVVAVTDFFDGYLARIWSQQSALGRTLDPIADKLLIAICILLLTERGIIGGWSIWAAAVILSREILVSCLREFLNEIQVHIPVTPLSKWKTTLQFVAIGILLSGEAGQSFYRHTLTVGIICLWISAFITLYTGYGYLRVGIQALRTKENKPPTSRPQENTALHLK